MKRSPLKRGKPLKRTGWLRRSGPLAKRSKTNSRPQDNAKVSREYKKQNPRCEWCGNPNTEECHILRGPERYTVRSNLLRLCHRCHFGIFHDGDERDGQIRGLHYKLRKGELDVDDFWFLAHGLVCRLHQLGERSAAVEPLRQELIQHFSQEETYGAG